MSREGIDNVGRRGRRPGDAAQASAARPTARALSRRAREQLQRRILFASAGAVGLLALSIVGFGAVKELLWFPAQPVAVVFGDSITLRGYTDALTDQMRQLQAQVAQASNNGQNPNAISGSVDKLINAQETLPEDVLDQQIEQSVIAHEAKVRGLSVQPSDIDNRVNQLLADQRAVLNAPTPTPTSTFTPRPTATELPEGFVPTPTATPSPTQDPNLPTPVPSPTATLDPLTPTVTRTPFPTRETSTPVTTATPAPTLLPDEFQKAYDTVKSALKSESTYRASVAQQLLRDKVKDALGADLPTHGPRAHVLRLATSTKDEARVAIIQLAQGFPVETIADDANAHPVEGRTSGDLGWVAKGAESPEFDDMVFSSDTPLNDWTDPFPVGNHFEVISIVERQDDGPYDGLNTSKMKDRRFNEWLAQAKQSTEIIRDLSPQERQWAVDRASKGIFSTSNDTRGGAAR